MTFAVAILLLLHLLFFGPAFCEKDEVLYGSPETIASVKVAPKMSKNIQKPDTGTAKAVSKKDRSLRR